MDFKSRNINSKDFLSSLNKVDGSTPFIKKLFEILVTIVVTNSTAERNFSKLKVIKNALKNRIADKNLTTKQFYQLIEIFQLSPIKF